MTHTHGNYPATFTHEHDTTPVHCPHCNTDHETTVTVQHDQAWWDCPTCDRQHHTDAHTLGLF